MLVKQRLARLVPGWVTHGSCSGADVGLARFTTYIRDSSKFLFDPANTSAKHVSLILRCIWP